MHRMDAAGNHALGNAEPTLDGISTCDESPLLDARRSQAWERKSTWKLDVEGTLLRYWLARIFWRLLESLAIMLALQFSSVAVAQDRPASQPTKQTATRPSETASEAKPAVAPAAENPATTQSASSQSAESRPAPPPFSNLHVIAAGRAYRSAQPTPEILEYVVRHHGIRTVINLRGENAKEAWYRREREACQKLGLKLIDIRTSASSFPSREALLALFDAISDPANEPILLHCKAGADRSGMAAAVWKMVNLKEPAKEALDQLSFKYGHIRSAHPQLTEFIKMFQPTRDWIGKEYQEKPGGKENDD